ncbi:MAG: response regulator [Ignavibacteriaceae bacterium]
MIENLITSETDNQEKRTILLVEDDDISQKYIKTVLKDLYKIIIVSSSEEALESLKLEKIDIVLMDISIRGSMNGLELTKVIKKTNEYSNIPVIAVTAHAFPVDRVNSIEAGCNDYISKPFNLNELKKMISELLKNPL